MAAAGMVELARAMLLPTAWVLESGVEVSGAWGVGVHFAGSALGLPAPNDYEVDVDGIVMDGVGTAFAFASAGAAYTRSSISGAVVRNASRTLAGPGKGAVLASRERWLGRRCSKAEAQGVMGLRGLGKPGHRGRRP